MIASTAFSGVTMATVFIVVWKGGRWTGRVDERLKNLEQALNARRNPR